MDEALARRDRELASERQRIAAGEALIVDQRRLIAAGERRITELDGVAGVLADLVVERDRELRELRAALESARTAGAEVDRSHELERLERRMAEIGAQARGQATRIRMQALRQAAQLATRMGERGSRPEPELTEVTAADPAGAGEPGRAAAPEPAGLVSFEGTIQLEIGPLRDFSQLVSFEDAARGIEATREVSVRRFSAGRATVALRLNRPVELLRELERRTPFTFRVRSMRDDRLILDLDE